MHRLAIGFYILLSVLTIPALSQGPAEFRIQKFNTENGLPSNGIKGLQWDEETGFLWIATEAGIVRYNGMELKTFSKEDEPHAASERILFMIKNNAGRIYTADNSGNIFYIKKNRLIFSERKKPVDDSENNSVSLTVSDQLYKTKIDFTKKAYSLQFNVILPIDDTSTFVIDNNALWYFSQSITSPVKALNNPLPIDIGFKYGARIFLLDAQRNIFLFKKGDLEPVSLSLTKTDGMTIEDFRKGTIVWENGMTNAILFNRQKAWLIAYEDGCLSAELVGSDIPGDVMIRYAQYDEKRKMLFIGTDSKGIITIKRNWVHSVKAAVTSPNMSTSYYSQVALPNGNVLTSEGHVVGMAEGNQTKTPIIGKFSTRTLLVGDSLLWFAKPDPAFKSNSSYLHSYNFHTGVTRHYPNVREGFQMVMALIGDKLYLARDSGIYRLNGDTAQFLFAYDRDTKTGMDYDMIEISPGILAIASCNALLRFDIKQNKLDTIYAQGNYCFRSIWKYKDYFFLGTYGGGLFIYKNGKIKALPLDKNKYLLFTHCFVLDDEGYCWISTNRGLFKANITELTDVFDKNANDVYYYYYGKNDGMEMTEMNGGCTPCAVVMKDKTISFPTMDGLLWVNPSTAKPVLPAGEIYFDNISIDNKLVNEDTLRAMPAGTEEIIVRLALPAWANKENIYIDYKLNEDAAWRPIDIDRGMEIRFNNLRAGDYKLLIRKRNGFGQDNYSYKELAFHITSPWYTKWWFYVMVVAIIAGLFRLYLEFRTRQFKMKQNRLQLQVAEKTRELQQKTEVLEKSDTIKTRLISIISHDIVTPLKFLTDAGKNLVENKAVLSENLRDETMREMINTSQELQLLSTNILNWIKYQNKNRRLVKEHFNVHELTNQVLGVLKSLAKQKNLVLKNETDPNLSLYQYYEPLKILIYNLVSNAINFTDGGSIIIGSNTRNGETILFVKDEGVGMTAEQIQNIMGDQFIVSSANVDNRKGNGLGYLIIKDLLEMMGGYFNIQSEKGKGTLVEINLRG